MRIPALMSPRLLAGYGPQLTLGRRGVRALLADLAMNRVLVRSGLYGCSLNDTLRQSAELCFEDACANRLVDGCQAGVFHRLERPREENNATRAFRACQSVVEDTVAAAVVPHAAAAAWLATVTNEACMSAWEQNGTVNGVTVT